MSIFRTPSQKNIMSIVGAILLAFACPDDSLFAQESTVPSTAQIVPLGGNTWRGEGSKARKGMIDQNGVSNWSDPGITFKTFFRINMSGSLKLWLDAKSESGESVIDVIIDGTAVPAKIASDSYEDIYVGEWNLLDTGYVTVELKGVSKVGNEFADIASLKIDGSAINEDTKYVKNDEGNFFYWGRRGPSVHLGYSVPEALDAKWYYNEITVPEGEDVIGSYYMANGFLGGYFGIQVNSETERRVLFSVWSPYETDNPEEIPEDQRIRLLGKGQDVNTGEFGNEGSGGQSFLRFNWKTGNTYKFLLKGEPVKDNYTNYTAWFYAPEEGQWRLIASFSRPKTNSWLTGFHSFLENFSPNQGIYEREVYFSNQWVADKNEKWLEINSAKFTADNTARMGYRLDYAGGYKDGKFYLRNCGFFDDYTPIDVVFERPIENKKPMVDFDKLPY